MPILSLILIHYIENLQYFHRENLKYQMYLMLFASIVNVFYTFWDSPVYVFMTYEDIRTPIFLIGGFLMLNGIFLGMGKVTQLRVKNTAKTLWSIQKKEEIFKTSDNLNYFYEMNWIVSFLSWINVNLLILNFLQVG